MSWSQVGQESFQLRWETKVSGTGLVSQITWGRESVLLTQSLTVYCVQPGYSRLGLWTMIPLLPPKEKGRLDPLMFGNWLPHPIECYSRGTSGPKPTQKKDDIEVVDSVHRVTSTHQLYYLIPELFGRIETFISVVSRFVLSVWSRFTVPSTWTYTGTDRWRDL